MKVKDYYYVICASGKDYIGRYAQYAAKSILRAGVDSTNLHICVNTKEDRRVFKRLVPKTINLHLIQEDIDWVKWTYCGKIRRYSLFKIAALYKTFPKPVSGKALVYLDGDVLFFKNPKPFFDKINHKTWFHHGKDYSFRAVRDYGITEEDVDVEDYDSLSKWVPGPTAYLLLKYGMSYFPKTEAVAGLYVLHPRDHAKLLAKTYKYTLEIAKNPKFMRHPGAGDQKPMNAALNVLNIDWHGGHRKAWSECADYMYHYFGIKDMKNRFRVKVKELGL